MIEPKYISEVEVALRAKTGIVWLGTREEVRIEANMVPVADQLGYALYTWTCTQGVREVGEASNFRSPETQALDGALKNIMSKNERIMLLCFDAAAWLSDPIALRTARDVHRQLQKLPKESAKQIIIVDQTAPPENMQWVTFIEAPLPDREEMGSIVDSFLKFAPDKAVDDVAENGNRNDLIGAMLGLTADDASNALARSLAKTGRFDIPLVSKEKARVVKGTGLEWYDPDPRGLDAVGGYDNVKDWLVKRKRAFGSEAREYGLMFPKGIFLAGVPGCGKSLLAKCVATAWNMPLLRMDVGALFSKYVGESEGKIRQALKTAETIAPCILMLDEIEKAFGGGGGESDGGTSDRVFGTFLTWMQDRKEGVFVIATANDLTKFKSKPEFLRAGRWDELWFVGLPTLKEREKIAEVMSKKFKACGNVDCSEIAAKCEGYTGSEIEQAYVDSMYAGFEAGRDVDTPDILEAIKSRIPLSQTMKESIDELKKWANNRARNASKQEERTELVGRSIE